MGFAIDRDPLTPPPAESSFALAPSCYSSQAGTIFNYNHIPFILYPVIGLRTLRLNVTRASGAPNGTQLGQAGETIACVDATTLDALPAGAPAYGGVPAIVGQSTLAMWSVPTARAIYIRDQVAYTGASRIQIDYQWLT